MASGRPPRHENYRGGIFIPNWKRKQLQETEAVAAGTSINHPKPPKYPVPPPTIRAADNVGHGSRNTPQIATTSSKVCTTSGTNKFDPSVPWSPHLDGIIPSDYFVTIRGDGTKETLESKELADAFNAVMEQKLYGPRNSICCRRLPVFKEICAGDDD